MPGFLPTPTWATGALVCALCAACAGFALRRAARNRRTPGARTARTPDPIDPDRTVDAADSACTPDVFEPDRAIGAVEPDRAHYCVGSDRIAPCAKASAAALEPPAAVRPLPPYCGSVRVEARYLSATPGATMGGDLYEVVETPFGVRALIGDVAGHGPDAAASAAEVLGAFRELAQHESRVAGIAFRIDAFLAGRADALGESYATAALVQITPDGTAAELVACGHPAPLALRAGLVIEACETGRSLPLGLQELDETWHASSTWVPLHPGDALLFFTDGILEARSPEGVPYPFAERVAALAPADPAAFLDLLQADLLIHTVHPPDDDVALLYLRPDREPARTADHVHPAPSARTPTGSSPAVG